MRGTEGMEAAASQISPEQLHEVFNCTFKFLLPFLLLALGIITVLCGPTELLGIFGQRVLSKLKWK